ncbi:MAG TPA: HAMP domain-containing sensor histidine kinase, partial [Desulfuromonadales bacterium]|nr:HAMP domain-containing sensor histidine kinase [Desulfuromonadales bacterium]
PARAGQMRELITTETEPGIDDDTSPLHLLAALPIRDSGELLALIAIFGEEPIALPDEVGHALQVIAERFLIVARYLHQIKKNEALKADFLSMLVHDLRAPLTGISGFAEVLASGQLGALTDEQTSALGNIQSAGEQMLMLIEDILDLAKLEAGKFPLKPAPLHLSPFAETIIQELEALALAEDLQIFLECPAELPQVLADERQMRRVITNLLSNAIKFTPRGGKIILSAALQEPSFEGAEHHLLISITDTGPGIPPEERQRLFTRYHQGSATRSFHKGTGLGLASCKEVVTRHGGTIWVETPEEGGSRFSFTLPVATV